MSYNSKYKGQEVEQLLDQLADSNLENYYNKTETDEKLSELGSELYILGERIKWEEGIIQYSGKFTVDTTYKATKDFISISKGTTIRLDVVTIGNYRALAFYSERNESSFMEEHSLGAINGNTEWTAPMDGYVRFCNRWPSKNDPTIEVVGKSQKKTEDSIVSLSKDLSILSNQMNRIVQSVWSRGTISIDNAEKTISWGDIWYNISGTEEKIASGSMIFGALPDAYLMLSYNLDDKVMKIEDFGSKMENRIVIATMLRSLTASNKIGEVLNSSINFELDGKNIRTEVDYLSKKKDSFAVVSTRGYINVDTSEKNIVLSANAYYNDAGVEKTIKAGTYSYELSNIGNNFFVLAWDGEKLIFINIVDVKNEHVVIGSFNKIDDLINIVSSAMEVRLDGVSIETRLKENDEKINSIKDELNIKAIAWDAKVSAKEELMRELPTGQSWYGVKWSETEDDDVTAINSEGDDVLHETLPLQSKMKRCIIRDGIVQYYLNSNNSNLKEDGTPAILDGSDGDVMVEIPAFFYKHETIIENGIEYHCLKISEHALTGYRYIPKRYTSAYEVTMNRETNKLASVCTTIYDNSQVSINFDSKYIEGNGSEHIVNTAVRVGFSNNAATYRGGDNRSEYDNIIDPSNTDYSRNQLGLPVCNLLRNELRACVSDGSTIYHYDTYRALFILCFIEYKTKDIQGSKGIGKGATVYPDYNSYEGYFLPVFGASCIPCGVTNFLGNNSGEVYYKMVNVPIKSDGSVKNNPPDWAPTEYGNVWMPCMSYRGVEHFYGHLYDIMEGLTITNELTDRYEEGYTDTYHRYHKISYYYTKNPYACNDKLTGKIGEFEFMANTRPISKLLLGDNCHIFPIESSANNDYSKNYCDCVEYTRKGTCFSAVNGRAVSNTLCGLMFFQAIKIDGRDDAQSFGTRIDMV